MMDTFYTRKCGITFIDDESIPLNYITSSFGNHIIINIFFRTHISKCTCSYADASVDTTIKKRTGLLLHVHHKMQFKSVSEVLVKVRH